MGAMPDETSGYRIDVKPLAGVVTARRGNAVLPSSNAAKFIRETRRSPTVYFPKDDVRALTWERTDHRSLCLFKAAPSGRSKCREPASDWLVQSA